MKECICTEGRIPVIPQQKPPIVCIYISILPYFPPCSYQYINNAVNKNIQVQSFSNWWGRKRREKRKVLQSLLSWRQLKDLMNISLYDQRHTRFQ